MATSNPIQGSPISGPSAALTNSSSSFGEVKKNITSKSLDVFTSSLHFDNSPGSIHECSTKKISAAKDLTFSGDPRCVDRSTQELVMGDNHSNEICHKDQIIVGSILTDGCEVSLVNCRVAGAVIFNNCLGRVYMDNKSHIGQLKATERNAQIVYLQSHGDAERKQLDWNDEDSAFDYWTRRGLRGQKLQDVNTAVLDPKSEKSDIDDASVHGKRKRTTTTTDTNTETILASAATDAVINLSDSERASKQKIQKCAKIEPLENDATNN